MAAVAPTFLHALELLGDTDLLAAFPAGVLESTVATRLTSRPVPVTLEPFSLHLVRHRRSNIDPAVTLVAELVRAVARNGTIKHPVIIAYRHQKSRRGNTHNVKTPTRRVRKHP